MVDDDVQAPAVVVLKDDGTCEVVVAFADGRRRMEDEWSVVDSLGLTRLHAV